MGAMTRYEELDHKADLCICAGFRCEGMGMVWAAKAEALRKMRDSLTVKEAEGEVCGS